MSFENPFDESLARYYESIRRQAEADRAHKAHFIASPTIRERAEKLREEMTRRKLQNPPSIGRPKSRIWAMKFMEERPLADPETAARLLLDLVRASTATSGLPHAYTGAINMAFSRVGGNGAEYVAGVQYGTEKKWFEVDRSETRITLLPDGSE